MLQLGRSLVGNCRDASAIRLIPFNILSMTHDKEASSLQANLAAR